MEDNMKPMPVYGQLSRNFKIRRNRVATSIEDQNDKGGFLLKTKRMLKTDWNI